MVPVKAGEKIPVEGTVVAGAGAVNLAAITGESLPAYASLTGREISLPLAQDVLRNVLQSDDRAVTIEVIQKFVADYYQLKVADLKSRNNSKSVAMPRQRTRNPARPSPRARSWSPGRSTSGRIPRRDAPNRLEWWSGGADRAVVRAFALVD